MSKDKVSIIVPVYNGEKYIEKCIDSIIKQTYKNIEIIIINDGSKDNTEKILNKYKKYDNIILINKENSGVSASRNIGIDKSSGKYILFIDSDDWISKDTIEIALNKIGSNDAIRFSHYIVDGEKITKKNNNDDIYSDVYMKITSKDLLDNLVANKTEGHLWNYLLRSDIIKKNKIYFDKELFYQEDVLFLIEYFLNSKKIMVISDPLYYYYRNQNSVTQRKDNIVRNLSSLKILRYKVLSILEINNCNLEYKFEQRLLNLQLMYFRNYIDQYGKIEFKKFIKEVAVNNLDYYDNLLSKKILTKKWRIFIILLKYKLVNLLYLYIKLYVKLKKK